MQSLHDFKIGNMILRCVACAHSDPVVCWLNFLHGDISVSDLEPSIGGTCANKASLDISDHSIILGVNLEPAGSLQKTVGAKGGSEYISCQQ